MANVISDYALLAVDEAKDALELGDDFDQVDTLVLFINGISVLAERYCGREFLSRERTEIFDGNGTNRYILREGLNTTAIDAISYRDYGTTDYSADDDTVPSASYKYNTRVGEVWLNNGYAFEKGFQNCCIVYTAGLTTVPDDIRLAAIIIIKKFWKDYEKGSERYASMSVEGQTVTFRVEEIPEEARGILNRRVRPRFA